MTCSKENLSTNISIPLQNSCKKIVVQQTISVLQINGPISLLFWKEHSLEHFIERSLNNKVLTKLSHEHSKIS